jgi:hypothetical protein
MSHAAAALPPEIKKIKKILPFSHSDIMIELGDKLKNIRNIFEDIIRSIGTRA